MSSIEKFNFDSNCICGNPFYEGDSVYLLDGEMVCGSCAKQTDQVCVCGEIKDVSEEYCGNCGMEEWPEDGE